MFFSCMVLSEDIQYYIKGRLLQKHVNVPQYKRLFVMQSPNILGHLTRTFCICQCHYDCHEVLQLSYYLLYFSKAKSIKQSSAKTKLRSGNVLVNCQECLKKIKIKMLIQGEYHRARIEGYQIYYTRTTYCFFISAATKNYLKKEILSYFPDVLRYLLERQRELL